MMPHKILDAGLAATVGLLGTIPAMDSLEKIGFAGFAASLAWFFLRSWRESIDRRLEERQREVANLTEQLHRATQSNGETLERMEVAITRLADILSTKPCIRNDR